MNTSSSKPSGSLPPGSPLPTAIQTIMFLRDPLAFLGRAHRRYGPVVRVRLIGVKGFVYVTDPALIAQVFAADRDIGLAGEARRPFLEPVVGSSSLLCTDGFAWERQRKLLGPPLHGQAITRYRDQIAQITAEEVSRWPIAEQFPLRPRMQAITLEVILRVVFGIDDTARLERLRILLPRLIAAAQWIVWMPPKARAALGRLRLGGRLNPWQRFLQVRSQVDALLYEEIAHRRNEDTEQRTDVLSLLLQARDEDRQPLSDRELRDHLITLLEAGHETTATALAWTFERLTRHRAVTERLLCELEQGDERYLDAVIKETLRTRPVLMDVLRVLREPMLLAGYHIPAGWYLAPAIAIVQQLPSIYPDPDQYRPERFLDHHPPPHTWLPFGGGRRHCVGSQLALLEMKTIIPEVLRHVHLQAANPAPERQQLHHITLSPAHDALVVARRSLTPIAPHPKQGHNVPSSRR